MFKKIWSNVTDAEHLGSLSTLTKDDELEELTAMTHKDKRVTIAETLQS